MSTSTSPAWRAIGFWLAVAIALLQGFNAFRAFTDPAGFATYLGAPLVDAADAAWVYVYGLRALFIALVVAALLLTRNLAALAWLALAGVVMPVGDAAVAHAAQAPTATVARHGAIAIYLLVTAALLFRWVRRRQAAAL